MTAHSQVDPMGLVLMARGVVVNRTTARNQVVQVMTARVTTVLVTTVLVMTAPAATVHGAVVSRTTGPSQVVKAAMARVTRAIVVNQMTAPSPVGGTVADPMAMTAFRQLKRIVALAAGR